MLLVFVVEYYAVSLVLVRVKSFGLSKEKIGPCWGGRVHFLIL